MAPSLPAKGSFCSEDCSGKAGGDICAGQAGACVVVPDSSFAFCYPLCNSGLECKALNASFDSCHDAGNYSANKKVCDI